MPALARVKTTMARWFRLRPFEYIVDMKLVDFFFLSLFNDDL